MAKNNQTVDRIQAIWNMIGGDDGADQLIAGTKKLVIETICRLIGQTSFTVSAKERNVHDFFQTRKGLCLSDNFKNLILNVAQKRKFCEAEATFSYADLAEEANDAEIGAGLPEGHVFTDVNVFLVFLATLIEAQWNNEGDGPLLNTGFANIFYVKIGGTLFSVDVRWFAGGGEWYCSANHPHVLRWGAGGRAFSATDAVSLTPAL